MTELSQRAAPQTSVRPLDGIAPKRKPPVRKKSTGGGGQTASPASARAWEQLRQQERTYDQHHDEARAWEKVRLCMGWMSVALLPVVTAAAVFVLVDHGAFSTTATTAATGTVLAQTVGLVAAVWRLVLGKGPAQLAPVIVDRNDSPVDSTDSPVEA